MTYLITICSSFRFYDNVLKIQQELEQAGIECEIPIPNEYLDPKRPWKLKDGLLTQAPEVFEAFWRNMEAHQQRILRSNIVYIFAGKQGYVGNGVSSEMGFSHAIKNHCPTARPKTILSSHQLEDTAMRGFIEEIVKPQDLVSRLR